MRASFTPNQAPPSDRLDQLEQFVLQLKLFLPGLPGLSRRDGTNVPAPAEPQNYKFREPLDGEFSSSEDQITTICRRLVKDVFGSTRDLFEQQLEEKLEERIQKVNRKFAAHDKQLDALPGLRSDIYKLRHEMATLEQFRALESTVAELSDEAVRTKALEEVCLLVQEKASG